MIRYGLLCSLLIVPVLSGCESRVKEENIEIKNQLDPMDQVKSTLQRYIDGQPLGSEAMMFKQLVLSVREKDAAKADILEKGFEDLQKASKGQLPGKAKSLKEKLGLN